MWDVLPALAAGCRRNPRCTISSFQEEPPAGDPNCYDYIKSISVPLMHIQGENV